ncbi:MAG: hypothetical protein Q8J76_10035, partial [Desulfobulbaceae bacterium]|nr:hypothetical protein [Desulfobulbaceae bacterium]
MKKLKLSAKIIGGFGVVILLMIGVIGVYQFSTIKTTRGFEDLLSNDVAQVNHAHQADIELQRALNSISQFMRINDMKEMEFHNQFVDGLTKHLTALKGFAQGEGDQGKVKVVEEA